ncbi:MAG: dNTP triphosphohydrolase [Bacteroidales bacterium]|nr:dNTP triphosphohydrolase [Bacteroidales bacterium]
MHWQKLISAQRHGREVGLNAEEYRSVFQRDFDRLIFSSPFRRMQNKTQVFPLPGSVFVHNRLTHSLEVSSVGRSLGTDVARVLIQRHPEVPRELFEGLGSIVSAACLAHDMGNPPFGHAGEAAITAFFKEGKGCTLQSQLTPAQWNDLTHFDGNANALRLLTHQFEGRRPGGFVMTYAMLASIVKYPYSSTIAVGGKPKFGFFDSEREDFKRIAETTGLICLEDNGKDRLAYCRHPLVYLVEAADDICYQIMDIEDAHKLHILSDTEATDLLLGFFDPKQQEHIEDTFRWVTDPNERIVYLRAGAINNLEHACVEAFLTHELDLLRGSFKGALIDHITPTLRQAYTSCSDTAFARIYHSRQVADVEISGHHILNTLLETLIEAVQDPDKAYSRLVLRRVPTQYQVYASELYDRIMAVLDHISSMTDVYALDLYRKLNGHSLAMV